MTKWNPKESEVILLPNLPFTVLDVKELVNDEVWEFTAPQMEAWLRETHLLPDWFTQKSTGSIDDPDAPRGPWPKLADKVKKGKWDGAKFIKWYEKKWSESTRLRLKMSRKEEQDLGYTLRSRFRLPSIFQLSGELTNDAYSFHQIELKDSEACE